MDDGGRRWPLAPESFVEARVATHLMWRLGSRVHAALSSRGAARTAGWRAVDLASVGVDLVSARALSRSDRFRPVLRWALDAADLAVWCMAAGDDPDTTSDSVIPGVALAAEAGARLGLAGMVVPLANTGVMAVVRRRRGHDLRLWQAGWQVMGVLGGMGLSISAARRRRAAEILHDRDLDARSRTAELAGAHAVMSDGDAVADRIQRATVLVDLGAPGARRASPVGAAKEALGSATRTRATFLGDALHLWQRRHNRHPDLRSVVVLDLEPAAGTVLLTASQLTALHGGLDALELRGPVRVELADPAEARRPDGRRDLRVDGIPVDVPRPAEAVSLLYDAVPTAFTMSALWFLPPLSDTREAVPLSATIGPLALAGAGAVWSARRANRDGLAPRLPAVALSALSTGLYTWSAGARARRPHSPDGASWYPWALALQGYELVVEHSAPDLPPAARWWARAGGAGLVALGWFRSPPPRSGRALVSEVVWPVGIA